MTDAAPPPTSGQRLVPFAIALTAILPAAFLFAGVLDHGFSGLGDDELLLTHDRWHGLDGERLEWMFGTAREGVWQPLAWLSFAAGHAIEGAAPRVIHATNVLLLLASTGLLGVLGARIAATWCLPRLAAGCGAVGALLWAVHPLRVEAVAWAAARGDALACPLLLGAAVLWWDAHAAPSLRPGRVAASITLLVLAALASPTAVFAPVALLALGLCVRARVPGSYAEDASRITLAALAALAALPTFVALSAALEAGAGGPLGEWGASGLLALADGIARGLRSSLWPAAVHPAYGTPPGFPDEIASYLWTSALLAAAILVAGATGLLRPRGPMLALAAYAALAAGPLLLTRSPFGADHFAHTATAPFALLVAGGLATLPARPRVAALGGACVAGGALFFASTVQLGHWQDAETLARHVLAVDPANEAVLARRGEAARQAGLLDAALADHRRSLDQDDRRALAHQGLGRVLMDKGRPEEAEQHLRRAIALAPWLAVARRELGVLLLRSGRLDDAVVELEESVRRDGESFAGWFALGRARALAGDSRGAAEAFRRALEFDPENARVREELRRAEAG